MCKNVCVTSSHLASSPSFLSSPHPLPTTLSPSYSIALAIFYLLAAVLSQYKFFNASLQLSS